MKKSEQKNGRSMGENIAKVFLISEVPKLAKFLIDAIPDLTYDRYLRDYKTIWNMLLPASSLVLLHEHAGSEPEKTFIVQMSAGINRAINERAARVTELNQRELISVDYVTHGFKSNVVGLKVKDYLDELSQEQFKVFMNRLEVLPAEQRINILNESVPDDEKIKDLISTFNKLQKNELVSSLREGGRAKEYVLTEEKSLALLFLKFTFLDISEESFAYMAFSFFSQEGKEKLWKKCAQKIKEQGINIG